MHCSKVRDKLVDFIDDDVRFSERVGIEVHVARCYACREELDELLVLQGVCRSASTFPGTGKGLTDLRDRIAEREAARQSVGVWGSESSRNAVRKFAVAALVFFIVGITTPFLRQTGPAIQQTEDEPQSEYGEHEILTVTLPFVLRKHELEQQARLAESVYLADTRQEGDLSGRPPG